MNSTQKFVSRLFLFFSLLFALALVSRATTISLSAAQIPNVQSGAGTYELRVWLDRTLVDSAGVVWPVGAVDSPNSYKSVTCALASTTVTCNTFTLASTVDAQEGATAKYTAKLYRNNAPLLLYNKPFALPASLGSSVTWEQIWRYNNTVPNRVLDNEYYTKNQVNALYAGSIFANPATTSTRGVGKSTMNVADPIFIETTDPLAGSLINVKHFTYSGTVYGLRDDGVQIDQASINALNSLIISTGGHVKVYFPGKQPNVTSSGIYNFGARTGVNPLNSGYFPYIYFTVPHVAFVGDGMGITELKYSSANKDGDHFLNLFNLPANAGNTDYYFADMTITDTYPNNLSLSGTNPSAIFLLWANNVLIERVNFVDIKGNGAIYAFGNTNTGTNPPTPTTKNIIVRNCLFDSTATGETQRDGLNAGNYDGILFENNTARGLGQMAFEGGGYNLNLRILNNFIDMQGQAGYGIGNLASDGLDVIGNRFWGCENSIGVINISGEATPSPYFRHVRINDNFIEGSTTGRGILAAIELANADTSDWSISRNQVTAQIPVILNELPKTLVMRDNIFTASGQAFGGSPSGIPVDGWFLFENNVSNKKFFDTSYSSIYGSSAFRFGGLVVTDTVAAETNAVGGFRALVSLPTALAGAISADQTTTVAGAIVNDEVVILPQVALPSGVTLRAYVASANTITWYVDNRSGSSYAGVAFGSGNNKALVYVMRRW